MKRKKSLILSVISTFILLAFVVMASYAYFATTVTAVNKINVTAETGGGGPTVITTLGNTSAGTLEDTSYLTLNMVGKMSQIDASNTTAISDDAYLTVNVTSNDKSYNQVCFYDLYMRGEASVYTPTAAISGTDLKEFTLEVSIKNNNSSYETIISEVQINQLLTSNNLTSLNGKYNSDSSYLATSSYLNDNFTNSTIINNNIGKIKAVLAKNTDSTKQEFHAVLRMYDLNLDQEAALKSKTFKYGLGITNLYCYTLSK